MAASIAVALAGYGPNVVFLLLVAVVAASALYAGVRAQRTTSAVALRTVVTTHMIVWISTVGVALVCLIVWMLFGATPNPMLAWLITGVGLLGWVAARSRAWRKTCPSRSPVPATESLTTDE